MTENYQSFMERCEIFFPHSECVKISVAYKLAKFHHRFDTRKDELGPNGEPVRYFEHARRVALIAPDELGIADVELVILSLLHDTIEDTRLTTEEITFIYGSEISRRVMLMSKKPKQGFHKRLLDFADWKVLLVKGCDRLDNIRSLKNSPVEFQQKQIKETREMYYPLMDKLVERTPEETKLHVQMLRATLRETTETLARYK